MTPLDLTVFKKEKRTYGGGHRELEKEVVQGTPPDKTNNSCLAYIGIGDETFLCVFLIRVHYWNKASYSMFIIYGPFPYIVVYTFCEQLCYDWDTGYYSPLEPNFSVNLLSNPRESDL